MSTDNGRSKGPGASPGPEDIRSPAPWRRVERWLLRVLVAAAAVVALYLVAANVLLGTRLLRSLVNSDRAALDVEYSSAGMFWPGTVRVKDLSIRARDRNVEWYLTIEEATFHASPKELAHKRFHTAWVDAHGVRFLARRREPAAAFTPAKLAALPRIPGFDDPPIAPEVEAPPPEGAEYHLWTVLLEGVHVDPVREIWVDVLRGAGDGAILGSFHLKPLRWVRVGPARVDMRRVGFSFGGHPVVEDAAGVFETTLGGFDPRDVHGAAVLDTLRVRAKGAGRVPDIAFLGAVLTGVETRGGAGDLKVDVDVDDGAVTRGGAEIAGAAAYVAARGHAVTASGRLTLRKEGDALVGHAALAQLVASRLAHDRPLLRANAFDVNVRTRDTHLATLARAPASVVLDLPDAELPDAHAFDEYLPVNGSPHILGGKGALRAHAEIDAAGAARGQATLSATDLALRVGDTQVRASGTLVVDAAREKRDAKRVLLSRASATIRDAHVDEGAAWSARVDARGTRIRLGQPLAVSAPLAGSCSDARPIVALLADNAPLPAWAADLVTAKRVKATAHLYAQPNLIEIRALRANVAKRFDLAGDFRKQGDRAYAIMLVTSGPLAFAVATSPEGTHVQLAFPREWFAEQERAFP